MANCPDCGAKPGKNHKDGCDVERCARCGGQTISCGCIYEANDMPLATLERDYPDVYHNGPTNEMFERWEREWGGRRLPWSGEWPGKSECRELGFWCKWSKTGWVRCSADDPESLEDLNRLVVEARWDQQLGRYVKREGAA